MTEMIVVGGVVAVSLGALFVAWTALRIVGGKHSDLPVEFRAQINSRKQK
jgi:hypothetical protein